ncbi:MAG TPA: 2-dehydropantoate 2-reductase N-terminal domain-containing protein [Kiloniellaceae bacterium]|nr:2-dehydropantoate 2-reductase N-terminal domain-containing protein [Kiloniellaceae bacterium]
MKIRVFGAGAIGGYIGALLAHKGDAEVSLLARGPHLAAMQAQGLTLHHEGKAIRCPSPGGTSTSTAGRWNWPRCWAW